MKRKLRSARGKKRQGSSIYAPATLIRPIHLEVMMNSEDENFAAAKEFIETTGLTIGFPAFLHLDDYLVGFHIGFVERDGEWFAAMRLDEGVQPMNLTERECQWIIDEFQLLYKNAHQHRLPLA